MIAQNIDFTVNHLIEHRTRVCGQLKKLFCGINRLVRARYIPELAGLATLGALPVLTPASVTFMSFVPAPAPLALGMAEVLFARLLKPGNT